MRLPLFASFPCVVLMLALLSSITITNAFTLPITSSSTNLGTCTAVYKDNNNQRIRRYQDLRAKSNGSHDKEQAEEEAAEETKRNPPLSSSASYLSQKESKMMDRRGTLFSLAGTAASFAVSDFVLGKLGAVVGSSSSAGKAVSRATSMYSAKWNTLYQRVAAQIGQHGTQAVATPELAAFIAKSPAALAHPELRAWLAAQKAFTKVVVAEEGMSLVATAAAAAAAVVAGRTRQEETEVEKDDNNIASTAILETAIDSVKDSIPPAVEAKSNANNMEDDTSSVDAMEKE